MKGAIGNAFIMNMVITMILIFFALIISGMAYSKAYKVKNYLLNSLINYQETNDKLSNAEEKRENWNNMVNGFLASSGYLLTNTANTCPKDTTYQILRDTSKGSYDYCIYIRNEKLTNSEKTYIKEKYTYKVLSYMKFDLPVVGNFIKVPLTGETKTFVVYK